MNNTTYIGVIKWGRQRYVKDPMSGARLSRNNEESTWVTREAPELRLVSDELWQAAKDVQGVYNGRTAPLWKKNRPKSLLSGMIVCGCCGGGYVMRSRTRIGCSAVNQKGTCDNTLRIAREKVEQAVLSALRVHLMDEALCREFCNVYTARMNELRREHNAALYGHQAEYAKLQREKDKIADSILQGIPVSVLKEKAIKLEKRLLELEGILASATEEKVIFHPNMADRYHKEIRNLLGALNSDDTRQEATSILRTLIDRVVLTPTLEKDRLTIDLIGDLPGILAIATQRDKQSIADQLSSSSTRTGTKRSLFQRLLAHIYVSGK